ncbi:C2H2-type zinc finger transcription factor, partial [Phycomyces blakesleeanus NRRL 1555(-)]
LPQRKTQKPLEGPHHRYHCSLCPKTFSRPSSLRIHGYSHTGEKPHGCPYPGCGRWFSVQSNMRRHLRVH